MAEPGQLTVPLFRIRESGTAVAAGELIRLLPIRQGLDAYGPMVVSGLPAELS